jgi:2-iminobutanoate/2-iminopropanoate deaminase
MQDQVREIDHGAKLSAAGGRLSTVARLCDHARITIEDGGDAMLTRRNPEGAPAPGSRYSQSIEVPPDARWLHISGQIGVAPDGSIREGAEAQIEQAWSNLIVNLKAAGMGPEDLVKVTVFLTRKEDIPVSRAVRQRMLGDAAPASTLLVVAGLASPDYLFEVEAIAAKA